MLAFGWSVVTELLDIDRIIKVNFTSLGNICLAYLIKSLAGGYYDCTDARLGRKASSRRRRVRSAFEHTHYNNLTVLIFFMELHPFSPEDL